MPYSSIEEARIKKLNGVPLTLAQVNWIANVADGIPKGKVESPWAVSIANFKRSYVVEGGKWVKRKKEEKEISHVQIEMKEDGRYHIVTVSTAAVEDKEGETFDIDAIDYDMKQAELHGDYPEYRVFHKKFFGFGSVEKQYRVGIFAIDEGTSYDDPFSLEVCEKMLCGNDGTWKVSRGFMVHEAIGVCPICGEGMTIRRKHMVIGFRCPSCKETYLGYKRVLKGVHFTKARTFDVTVTDVPAVPWTSAAAFGMSMQNKEFTMTKKQLKEKLLAAGITEDVVEARLKDVSEEQLKEFDDIPDAILKELDLEDSSGKGDNETVFVLDTDVLKEFAKIVKAEVAEALDGISIEVPDMEMELKELPAVDELVKEVAELKSLVAELLEKDEKRLKQMLKGAPRAARLRIRRFKAEEEDEDDDEDEDEDENGDGKRPPFLKKKKSMGTGDRIVTGTGEVFGSMTEAVMGG